MPRLILRFATIFVLLTLLLIFAHNSTALADGPDFSNVTDILGGRRTLFPNDDLVVTALRSGDDVFNYVQETAGGGVSSTTPYDLGGGTNTATGVGRFFNSARDVAITVEAGGVFLIDQNNPNGPYAHDFLNNLGGQDPAPNVLALADFTGDDLTDFAFIENGNINVMTAADVNDETQGFLPGTPTPLPQNVFGANALAAGDFDGDGINELAFAGVGPGFIQMELYKPQVTTDGQGKVTAFSLLNIGSTLISSNSSEAVALTAGAYTGATNPTTGLLQAQLLLLYNTVEQNSLLPIVLQPISITAATAPQVTMNLANPVTYSVDGGTLATASLRSGYLDFFSNTEQAVVLTQGIGYNGGNAQGKYSILTFDNNLNITIVNSLTTGKYDGWMGLTLGNFDQPNSDTLTLEIGVVEFKYDSTGTYCTDPGYAYVVQIYQVDPSNGYAIHHVGTYPFKDDCIHPIGTDVPVTISFGAGDLQGRSLFLGTPTKITSDSIQPHLIVAAPPMHADYIPPANVSQPAVLNLSMIPRSYYSNYQTTITNQAQSIHKGTSSFTNAAKVNVTGGYQFGGQVPGSVNVTVGASAGYMHDKFEKSQYGEYRSSSFDASTNTGLGDQIWYSEQTHNIYAFPIIGHTVCPEDNPNCSPAQEVPQIVLLSGPSNIQDQTVNGAQVEWYQPVQEPGNVFSYPWNLAQLEAREGNIDLLTSAETYFTDSAPTTATANWSGQSSQSVTSGNSNQITWGSFLSIVKKASTLGGYTGSLKLSYNGSKSFSSLNTESTTLGESTGIGIVKPGTFANPAEYQYAFVPYIFGDKPIPEITQKINLNTTVETGGILRAEFTADPTDPNAGSWWSQAYTQPDVALAHPARWQSQVQNDSDTIPLNCLRISGTGTPSDCVYFNTPQTDIWTSEFHWMKGLLITPANANGEGPQIDHAAAGEQVQLQARVYNDSLTDMPAGSQIVVQFYAQPWNQITLKPAGSAFLINNVTVSGLPGFNSATSGGANPNWEMASTSFDTTPYSDKYLAFWVLVVLKDSQGNPVAEMPAHGLTGIPPTLNSIAEATTWVEPYSNNLGFYKSLFYVAPPAAQAAAAAPAKPHLSTDPVNLSKTRALLGDKIIVSALVHSNADTDGFSVVFYDSLPKQARQLFDVDEISHIRGNDAHLLKTVYHADACGVHTLSITGANGTVNGGAKLTVTINAKRAVTQLTKLFKTLNLKPGRNGGGFAELLQEAKAAFKHHDNKAGLDALEKIKLRVQAQRGNKIPQEIADRMLAQLNQIFTCVN